VSVGLAAGQSTGRHNVLPQTTEATRRLDRGVYRAPIPARTEPAYHRMARKAGKTFIDRIDNWLLAHRADPAERDVCLVCTHVFAGTQALSRPPRNGKRREQR
jgi:hypothetical protein